MKRLNKLISITIAILMVLSCSIDVSMLPVYADETPAKVEESADQGEPSDSEKDNTGSDAEKEQSDTEKGDSEKPSQEGDESDEKENSGSDSKKPEQGGNKEAKKKEDSSSEKDKLHQREIKAKLIKDDLYLDARKEKKTELNKSITDFWRSLTDRTLEFPGDTADFTVTAKGKLPDDVTAECKYILLDEADEFSERGLAGLSVLLYDKDGKPYIPEKDIIISIEGSTIKDEIKDNSALIVYSYMENKDREEEYTKKYKSMLAKEDKGRFYAADVLVYEGKDYDHARSLYEQYDEKKSYKDGEDAVRYKKNGDGLNTDKDSVRFTYDREELLKLAGSSNYEGDEAISFVIAAQQEEDKDIEDEENAGDGDETDSAEDKENDEVEDSEEQGEPEEETEKEDEDEVPPEKNVVIKGQVLTASDGKTYEVTVTCGENAGIPENAELRVADVSGNFNEYSAYLKEAARKLGKDMDSIGFAHAFDITIVDPESGEEYQPDADVKVSIKLLTEHISADEDIDVVHFQSDADRTTEDGGIESPTTIGGEASVDTGKAEIIDSFVNKDGEIEFRSSGFSVYMVLQAEGDDTQNNSILSKEMIDLEGNWATWEIRVNSDNEKLDSDNDDETKLKLTDTFTNNQSVDYASINVDNDDVTYDYRSQTGTFMIPDQTAVTITYRARITAQPGDTITFGNTAKLFDSSDTQIKAVKTEETHVIYPSPSDVASTTGEYMVKAFVYGDANMQTGIPGAEFILMDANQRIMTYKKGAEAGESIIFTTGNNGYVNIQLDEEECGVSIQKNTAYYIEMTKAPEGYKKDTTLYSFMITDDPDYETDEGVWTYYNGDTMKMRLYPEAASLNVSMRFSGNYSLTDDQKDNIKAILQKRINNEWVDIEEHEYSEFSYGSITFDNGTSPLFEVGGTYRVKQENQKPWDLDSDVNLSSTYYLIRGRDNIPPATEPQEFTVTEDNKNLSVNVVINNEYEKHELKITKMNKETGEKLSGATFTVYKFEDDSHVTEYTTSENGTIVITGGAEYESETLYYVVETVAPAGYLRPVEPQNIYFYFCNDPVLEPSIIEDLPAGETAVNLSESYDSLTLDNQKETRDITVMKIWQGNDWPTGVDHVVIGLYQSVGGADPVEVKDENNEHRTVTLNAQAPYKLAFTNLPARDDQNRTIKYSIKELGVYATSDDSTNIIDQYVHEDDGISDSGVYIVKNSEATTLEVTKEWYNGDTFDGNNKVNDPAILSQQQEVTFDIYRSATKIPDDVRAGGITNAELESLLSSMAMTKVRSDQKLSNADNWETTVTDLPLHNDLGERYYYYVHETVPSFGDEIYEVDEENRTATIKNKVAPEQVTVTVAKAPLVGDPRPESADKEFEFTLELKKGTHPIREYTVFDDGTDKLTTDWDGKVTFTLKANESIQLSLPVNDVSATVIESYNPEYIATSAFNDGSKTGDSAFNFNITNDINNKSIIFTNTLRVICNVVDKYVGDHVFESFKSALKYVREHPADYYETVTIQMLEDYVMPESDEFEVGSNENIILTTAPTENVEFPYKPGPSRTGEDTAIVTRGSGSGSMLTNSGKLRLEKIILDGAKDTYPSVEVDGGIVMNAGTLDMTNEATLRNSSVTRKGGAIYSEGTVNMPGGSITGNSASSGSAIYLKNCTLNMTGGEITNNTVIGEESGAVAFNNTIIINDEEVPGTDSKINLSGNPVIYDNYNSENAWSNIYLNVDSDLIINVESPGLDRDAQIGVRAMETHREIGEQFATTAFDVTDNLDSFVNDLYEYRGKLKDGTSTNVVWNGLTLTLRKVFGNEAKGANENDRFTITLTSTSIRRSNYTINGSLDYTVTPTDQNIPGTIVFRNVKASDTDNITIYPLSVGTYTISEEESYYQPSYTIRDTESGSDFDTDIEDGGEFTLQGDSTVTATNTRRLADVDLTKTLDDRLKGDSETQEFDFTVELIDADGSAIKNYILAEAEGDREAVITGSDGKATFNMLPSNAQEVSRSFKVPVGSTMSIIEAQNDNYRVTVDAVTDPSEGEPAEITDADTENDNVFTFQVTDDGADVTFNNVRKMADIDLSKTLVGKVSAEEEFNILVALTRIDGHPASNYLLYRDSEDPTKNITTDGNGKATIQFSFERDDDQPKNIPLVIPEGTKLEVSEEIIKKTVGTANQEIYDTKAVVNGEEKTLQTTTIDGKQYKTHTFSSVSDDDESIAFTNTRKTKKIKVTNTVSGYSGNVVPFKFTATVTDGDENDYDLNGFENGVQEFELTTGQSKEMIVPYGAKCTIAEDFIVGYETTIKHGNTNLGITLEDTFTVSADVTVAFNNAQLIGLRLVNNTSNTLNNVKVEVGYGKKIYRVNDEETGQEKINSGENKYATLSIDPGKTAILEIEHQTSVTSEQTYSVSGVGGDTPTLTAGYYYTINNEPSFHEFADPAVLRIYNDEAFEVKGKLRYSVADSIVTFNEQSLVSFDPNGGIWTTEMEGYHDRDGDHKVYQMAVDKNDTVSRPVPDPKYPAGEIEFLGWTEDKDFAEATHTEAEKDTEEFRSKLYDFDTPVTEPFTLYAVWLKEATDERIVTVKNETADSLTIDVTLTNDIDPIGEYQLYTDTDNPDNNITTDIDGKTSFVLLAGAKRDLTVPDNSKLVLADHNERSIAYSPVYTDADDIRSGFTIDTVRQDGTVSFIAGICKITNSGDDVLYDVNGKPAVYASIQDAFTAYNGTLYTSAAHDTVGTPAKVKMLIDEFPISTVHSFPNKNMILTTADKNDEDFPYVGVRDRATLFRSGFTNSSLFEHKTYATEVELTNIILDGKDVGLAKTANGGLISVNKAGAELTIEEGATLRNVKYSDYSDGNNSRGGAIYLQNGTLNVYAGLFSNLNAYQGGAICVTGGTLNVEAEESGSINFEDCCSERQDGGAIYYNRAVDLTIDGGEDKDNPGIVFTRCVAKYTNGTGDGSDGGAIFATSNYNNTVTVKGCAFIECSAKTGSSSSTYGYGGGGINAYKVKGLTISYCQFEVCDTLCGGGAVAAIVKFTNTVDNQTVNINNCDFNGCNSKSQGGALAVYQDKNEELNSATKLSVISSNFTNCSSGTNNGSGGAIQCYLPCMVFTDSTFTDCWAGKEGGAVNNFFGKEYVQLFENSSMTVTDCHFIRCRAEDRYDTTALQHYGGGINTKAKTVNVSDSSFEDCVSTLKEGGALHIGGQGTGSNATITNTEFKNCMAKNGGGAVLSSHQTLLITDSRFYGCSSSASNGGAVYHYRNSRGDSTQNSTTITGCTFSAEDSDGESCSAANNGGAIWTRAANVSIGNCTIDGCKAGVSGGGIYLCKSNSQDATISGTATVDADTKTITYVGTITNCQATKGSAVYVEDKATFSSVGITGNIVSTINDGAIHGGSLYFEGNVTVKDNICSVDPDDDHDALMQNDNPTTINTTNNGLDEYAQVGVYVPDENGRFNKYGQEGQKFGTHGTGNGTNYLDGFFNDRIEDLYGYQEGTDGYIYWGCYLCKITDKDGNTLKRTNGRDAIYQRLTLALNEFNLVKDENEETGKAVYIKMLVEDYKIQQTAQIENFPAGADITLTTEKYTGKDPVEGEYDGKHPYRGTEGTVCTISRVNSTNQLFKLNSGSTTFQLKDITLDGRKNKTASKGDYRLIEVASGSLIVNGGTTLQYGYANNSSGGAIYVSGETDTSLEICSSENADVRFDHCVQNGSNDKDKNMGGGAINSKGTVTISNESGGKIYFNDCSAVTRGGAIMLWQTTSSVVDLEVTGAEFTDCHSGRGGGAIYHNNTKDNTKTILDNCRFENCYSAGVYSFGGAVATKTAKLEVKNNCEFNNCYTEWNGGAINHGMDVANRTETIIKDTTFENCRTVSTDNQNGYGGSVSTLAVTVTIEKCTFSNSESSIHGGALFLQSDANNSEATISGTTFENCSSAHTNDGRGGAIYTIGKELTINNKDGVKSKIQNCTAPGKSGAIYMATSGSSLNISGGTIISSSYAKQGGAIYLESGVTLYITGSPEFTRNGYTTEGDSAEKGACIYLKEGSKVDLSGKPKFSRNNLPGEDRIVNGGITDYVRQDLYLAGYKNVEAESIYISGDLTGDVIWVWPEESLHQSPGDQFAITKTAENVDEESLNMFRNALPDGTTGCTNGEYLAGVRLTNHPETNVYWSKMYNVRFQKRDNKAVGVPGAEFTLYTDSSCDIDHEYTSTVSGDTGTIHDDKGDPLPKGTVYFTTIPIGVYYMKETQVPTSFDGDTETTYIVLVGSPYLSENDNNRYLWEDGGPLDVPNAEDLIARHTINAGIYYGIYPLEDGKANLSRNLASASVGIINTRIDYPAYFMKVNRSGAPLPNAEFTIYTQEKDEDGNPVYYENGYPKLKPWSRDGDNYPDPVKSADGSAKYKDKKGQTLPKGLVYFRELPIDTFYLKETYYPDRSGSNRKTYYVETDRVLKLTVNGENDFELEEIDATGPDYTDCDKTEREYIIDGNTTKCYSVENVEAVCKITDKNDNLLYEMGRDGTSIYPAIYSSLEEGFDIHSLYTIDKSSVGSNPPLKLKALKDFTLDHPITIEDSRDLTFTTAERNARDNDRYVFTTNRTTDTSRAEIKRNYSENTSADANRGALITVSGSATSFTLENIKLNGQKSSYNGRAVHVTEGSTLNVRDKTEIKNFKQEASAESTGGSDVRGGAILLDSNTTLHVDGGASRSVMFTNNEVNNERDSGGADGGAIAVGDECTVDMINVRFSGNKASASAENEGNGGAISILDNYDITLKNNVFTSNSADHKGGAIHIGSGSKLVLENNTIQSNTAYKGSAVYIQNNVELTISGGNISGNRASAVNGGAINGAGENHVFYFTGNPVIYNNYGAKNGDQSSQQKNVVLSVDSNERINTTSDGLGSKAKIGVYVIDGEDGSIFTDHGAPETPFGTFVDTPKNLNLAAFKNDRNAGLYGVRNEENDTDYLIYWSAPDGIRRVILRKVGTNNISLSGAKFKIHIGTVNGPLLKGTDINGHTDSDEFESGDSGVFYTGDMNYGTYYIEETKAPTSPAGYSKPPEDHYFIITIGENGVGYSTDGGKTFTNEVEAKAA